MINDYYTSTYILYNNSGSFDANGDYSELPVTGSTGKCKLTPSSGNKIVRNTDKGEVIADYRIYMPVVSLDEFDTISIDGNSYYILFIANRCSNHLEVDVSLI